MTDESVNIEKIKEIFANATGERVIEVTQNEYQSLLKEATAKKLNLKKEDESFTLIQDELSIKIVCDPDDEDEDEEEDY